MSKKEIDQCLGTLDEAKTSNAGSGCATRSSESSPTQSSASRTACRRSELRGKTIAGFAAFKGHLSYLPHSGSVIPQLAKETEGYTKTEEALHFPVEEPLPTGAREEAVGCSDGSGFRPQAIRASTGRRQRARSTSITRSRCRRQSKSGLPPIVEHRPHISIPMSFASTSGRIVPARRARSISSAVSASSSSCSACACVQAFSPALASAYWIPASLAVVARYVA